MLVWAEGFGFLVLPDVNAVLASPLLVTIQTERIRKELRGMSLVKKSLMGWAFGERSGRWRFNGLLCGSERSRWPQFPNYQSRARGVNFIQTLINGC